MNKTGTTPSLQRMDTSFKVIWIQICNKERAAVLLKKYWNKPNVKLDIICKIKISSCRYTLTWYFEKEGWRCELAEHVFTIVICCDVVVIFEIVP